MIVLLLCIISLFLNISPVEAKYDPLSVPNNPYGMHIVEYNDVPELPGVVNTNGGDWGYVTFVLSERDLDRAKIQRIFDQMRRNHLIPIVRLATKPEGPVWIKPTEESFNSIVDFLMKLNWPVENRYVVLYNEPNHANEWGGTIDPEGYAKIAVTLGKKLKEASNDFFILPAGLDVSAGSDTKSLNAEQYIRRMVTAEPEFLQTIDGWTSHSYPNPAFSGSPMATGRGSLRSFQWELSLLESLGFSKKLPVFITETGWIHAEGVRTNLGAYSSDAIANHITTASEYAWKDPRIAAITPFVFNYQDVPFDGFSWKTLGNTGLYSFAQAYERIPKTLGTPHQRESYEMVSPLIPDMLIANSSYHLTARVKNLGQGILDQSDGYSLQINQVGFALGFLFDPLPIVEPFSEGELSVHIRTPSTVGAYAISLVLKHNGRDIPLQSVALRVLPPPSVSLQAPLGWRQNPQASDAKVLIYDQKNELIHKFEGLDVKNGTVTVTNVVGIVPGALYRVVLIVPSYLPRQTIAKIGSKETILRLKRLYPFDVNKDGALTLADVFDVLFMKPISILPLFI